MLFDQFQKFAKLKESLLIVWAIALTEKTDFDINRRYHRICQYQNDPTVECVRPSGMKCSGDDSYVKKLVFMAKGEDWVS